jgi:hypothetical protein
MGAIVIPIPVSVGEKTYREVKIKRTIASVIADTHQILEKGDTYKAIQKFVSGCLESIDDVTDKLSIYNIVSYMPYKSAFYLATRILMLDEKDDGVEGMYICPRCQNKKICEFNEDPSLDTRDYLKDLPIRNMEGDINGFEINLSHPIEIKDVDGNAQIIDTLFMEYPTLNHCSMAFNKVGGKDDIRLQLAIYVQALQQVNGDDVDKQFKNSYGMYIFEQMERDDIRKLGVEIDKYGMSTAVKKICNKCGKEFTVNLNTANFFVSALQ